jgi:hypothetical protein
MAMLRKSTELVTRKIGNKTLLIQMGRYEGEQKSFLFELNETAEFLWENFGQAAVNSDEDQVIGSLSAKLAEEFDIEPTQAETDVRDFVNEMKRVRAIQCQ